MQIVKDRDSLYQRRTMVIFYQFIAFTCKEGQSTIQFHIPLFSAPCSVLNRSISVLRRGLHSQKVYARATRCKSSGMSKNVSKSLFAGKAIPEIVHLSEATTESTATRDKRFYQTRSGRQEPLNLNHTRFKRTNRPPNTNIGRDFVLFDLKGRLKEG